MVDRPRAPRAAPGNPAPKRGPADLRCPVEDLAPGPSTVEGRKKARPTQRAHFTNFKELFSSATLDSGRSGLASQGRVALGLLRTRSHRRRLDRSTSRPSTDARVVVARGRAIARPAVRVP